MIKNSLRFFVLLFCVLGSAYATESQELNGFDLRELSIPQEDVFHGGPPREGIPAIDVPKFIDAPAAEHLTDEDRVLGVTINGVSRAYPIRILTWHEIVNDVIGDKAFSVTYCPLCGSGMVFSADILEKKLTFGVSGLIYDNNMLLFDRNTQSLWSQIMGEAISGELKGTRLELLPVQHTTWGDWRKRYPETQVLSTDTGFAKDYTDNPYELYQQVGMIYFPRRHLSPHQYHPHESVVAIELNGVKKAYPFVELSQLGQRKFSDRIGGKKVWVYWDEESRNAYVTDESDRAIAQAVSYWFAWYSFNPKTEIFMAEKYSEGRL